MNDTGVCGRGLDQTTARRLAKALGGIAQFAKPGKRGWNTGVWGGDPHARWIVTTLSGGGLLHDGTDRRTPQERAARPLTDTEGSNT